MTHPNLAVERYRRAVMMRSRSEDRWRTARQHIDAYECWYAWEPWKREAQEALDALPPEFRTPRLRR